MTGTATRRVAQALCALGARLGLLALLAFLVLAPRHALADDTEPKIHVVYKGQRLGSIAKRYNVPLDVLLKANGIRRTTPIKPKQKLVIPGRGDKDGSVALRWRQSGFLEGKFPHKKTKKKEKSPDKPPATKKKRGPPPDESPRVHVVQKGQRLGSIAKRYVVSVDALCYANGITRRDPIHPGDALIVPAKADRDGYYARQARAEGFLDGYKKHERSQRGKKKSRKKRGEPSWAKYSKPPWKRGYVTVIGYNDSWKGYVIDRRGRVISGAKQQISKVLNSTGKRPRIHSRLIKLIAKVSDKFGGRPLRIVSGYRTRSHSATSRHKTGRAVDFSIPGVPNRVLRDYVRTFSNVGVGYYPNSSFIHLDVRSKSTYWIDYSGPGQAPIYKTKKETAKEAPEAPAPSPDADEGGSE